MLWTLTQSQPVGCGVTEVRNHLAHQLDQVADLSVQEIQGVVSQGKYVEMSALRERMLGCSLDKKALQRCL